MPSDLAGQLGMATPLWDLLGSSDAEMEAEFQDYAALGVKWVRTDFWWHLAQPVKNGGYNWAVFDKVVAMAEKYGIEIVAELNGYPSNWIDGTFSTRASQTAFGAFAAAAAAHFGDKVDHWEIFNEPNMQGITPANYTAILKLAYTAIKAVDAGDVVITGGLAAAPATNGSVYGAVDYLKGIYANGGGDYFDAVGYHPYAFPYLPQGADSWNGWQIMEDGIRATMVANGDAGLRVWMTEIGAPTAGSSTAVTEATQSTTLIQAVTLAQKYDWAGPVLWYSYKDKGLVANDIESWFGMVRPDGSHKALYDTFMALAHATAAMQAEPTFTGLNHTAPAGADTIVGNDRDNKIWAGRGDDLVIGGGGDDLIIGQWGNDTLVGGSGNDTFDFNDAKLMGSDLILDFSRGDRIDLRGIDADVTQDGDQAFRFIGSQWLSKAGDLGAYADPNGWTSVTGDVNGDGAVDFCIRVAGTPNLVASDFLL